MLSSPDALASFLLIAGLLALAVPQGAPLARGVIGGGSLALALATRSTLAIPLLLLVLEGWRGGGGGGRWFRSPLVLGALAGLLLDRSIGRLVVGLPEGYNQLTLLEFSLDGPLGADWLSRGAVHNLDPALLLAGGGAIPFAGLMLQAYGDLVETVLPLLAVVLLTALLIAVPWRREGALLRAGSGVAWARVRLVLALVGGYLLQLLLFPQPDGRFLAPYALLILLIAAGWVIPDTRAAP